MTTYKRIFNDMCSRFRSKTGIAVDEASDIGIRFAVLSAELEAAVKEIEWLKTQMFPSTAVGEYLELHAAQRGLSRKEGTKAVGRVRFFVPDERLSFDVSIPKGTVCAARGYDPVRFETTVDASIPAGGLSVEIPCCAVDVGAAGNVGYGKIRELVTSIVGIDSIINNSEFMGGSDPETDEELRARIIDSFVNPSNGTNKAFYKKTARAVQGVTAVGVIPRNRGAGTVDVFITGVNKETSNELLESVRETLQNSREINVDVAVLPLTICPVSVYVDITVRKGFSVNSVKAQCESTVKRYIDGLDAGEDLYLENLGSCILNVSGVRNYKFDQSLMYDSIINEQSLLKFDHMVITGSEEV